MKRLKDYGLTDMLIVVCIVKLAITQTPSIIDVAALFVGMIGLMHKRYEANKAFVVKELIHNLKADLSNLEAHSKMDLQLLQKQIDETNEKLGSFRITQDKLEKSAEDIKKVISTTNLGNALYKRTRT
jgi:hypothetical protein